MRRVREAREPDVPRLLEILRLSPEAGVWPEADLRRSIADSGARRCLAAVEEGRVVGFLLAQTCGDEAEILTLAVAPEIRRRGVGRGLLEAFLRRWRGRVFLEVRASNHAAQALYRSLGFLPAGLRQGYYTSPSEDAIVMQLTCF